MSVHFYYLHTNGDLIHKTNIEGIEADFRDSDLVRMFWRLDTDQRYDAWRILIEALALGACTTRVNDLAETWGCNDEDAKYLAEQIEVELSIDGSAWCATRSGFHDLAEDPAGFGDTCLEAIADLLKRLDFQTSKTWGATMKDYLIPKQKERHDD